MRIEAVRRAGRRAWVVLLVAAAPAESLSAQAGAAPAAEAAARPDSITALPDSVLATLRIARILRPRVPARPVLRLWEAGAMVGLTAGALLVDQRLEEEAQEGRSSFRNGAASVGNAFGTALYVFPTLVAGTLAGRAFHSPWLEGVASRALESTALAAGAAMVLKSSIGRRRPNVRPTDAFLFEPFTFKDNSFPSGHTTIAFALATSLALETRDHWSDAVFFGAAALTGYARINDDKHWLSDTIVGAGLGIVSARLIHRWRRSFTLTPCGGGLSLSF